MRLVYLSRKRGLQHFQRKLLLLPGVGYSYATAIFRLRFLLVRSVQSSLRRIELLWRRFEDALKMEVPIYQAPGEFVNLARL